MCTGFLKEMKSMTSPPCSLSVTVNSTLVRYLTRYPANNDNVWMFQMGFAIRVEGGRLTADLEDVFPDFSMAFEGGEDGGTFYHSDSTRQLDAEYGDMLHKILDLEVRCK